MHQYQKHIKTCVNEFLSKPLTKTNVLSKYIILHSTLCFAMQALIGLLICLLQYDTLIKYFTF